MNIIYEEQIEINENIAIKYLKTQDFANIYLLSKEKNILSKSATSMSFKGLLNLLAFYCATDQYTIDQEGIVLYIEPIQISADLYLQLEDSQEYFDESQDEVVKDFDEGLIVALHSKVHQIELASYYLDESVIQLFDELEYYKVSNERSDELAPMNP